MGASPHVSARTTWEIGILDDEFTVNESPEFLVFVSYFDALDVDLGDIEEDFDYLRGKGVDGVRIFVNWWHFTQSRWDYPSTPAYYANDTLIDENGDLRSGTLSKLLDILAIAKDEELMVDLTFSAETVGDCSAQDCPPGTNGPSLTHTLYKAGIVDMATVISGGGSAYKHVFFDLQNEFDRSQATCLQPMPAR